MASAPFLLDLVSRVPPPSRPQCGALAWPDVFEELGTRLPADYIEFMDAYGSCEFGAYLGIGDPRDADPPSYHRTWCDFGDDLRAWREEFPDDEDTVPPWPEPGGFLGWGNTIDADWFGWLTLGEPNRWPVAIWGRHRRSGIVGDVSMTEFLAGWLSSPPAYDLPDLSEENDPGVIRCARW